MLYPCMLQYICMALWSMGGNTKGPGGTVLQVHVKSKDLCICLQPYSSNEIFTVQSLNKHTLAPPAMSWYQ